MSVDRLALFVTRFLPVVEMAAQTMKAFGASLVRWPCSRPCLDACLEQAGTHRAGSGLVLLTDQRLTDERQRLIALGVATAVGDVSMSPTWVAENRTGNASP